MEATPPTVQDAPSGPKTLPMTYEEYLAWEQEGVGLTEWVDGEVIVHMPPKPLHQDLVSFLDRLVGAFVDLYDLGKLYVSPIEVKLWPDGPSREPDLVFLSNSNRHRITSKRIVGAPDLIIEIVSTESVRRDRVDKHDEYEGVGVREYWVIDNRPGQRRALFHQLAPDGQYQRVPIEEDGVYRSAVLPGFWLRVDWLWHENLNFLPALAEIIGPDQIAEALRRTIERP